MAPPTVLPLPTARMLACEGNTQSEQALGRHHCVPDMAMLDDPSAPTPTERQEWSTAPCGTHPPSVGASGRRLRDSLLT